MPTSAALRALSIQEILRHVLSLAALDAGFYRRRASHLPYAAFDKRDLLKPVNLTTEARVHLLDVARTCRAFCDPALDTLWYHLDIWDLYRMILRSIYKYEGLPFTLEGTALPLEVAERLERHSHRTRILDFLDSGAPEHLPLKRMCGPHFKRALTFQVAIEDLITSSSLYQVLPAVRELSLYLDDDDDGSGNDGEEDDEDDVDNVEVYEHRQAEIGIALTRMASDAQSVTSLYMRGLGWQHIPAIQGFQQLRELEIRMLYKFRAMPPEPLSLTSLTYLSHALITDEDLFICEAKFEHPGSGVLKHLTITAAAYKAEEDILENLEGIDIADALKRILNAFSVNAVQHLELTTYAFNERLIPASMALRAFAVMAQVAAHRFRQSIDTLILSDGDLEIEEDGTDLLQTLLEPWLSVRGLLCVEVTFDNTRLCLSDDLMQEIAFAWPELKILNIDTAGHSVRHAPTIHGLRHLTESCQKLTHLWIPLDMRGLPCFDTVPTSHHSLQDLIVQSIGDEFRPDNTTGVAEWIYRVFPHVRVDWEIDDCACASAWADIAFLVDDMQSDELQRASAVSTAG